MKVYFIPGLGFDSRIFRNLRLDHIGINYIEWIEPLSIDESISAYAARLANEIEDQNEKVILIGHSFGGIISQEIARIKKVNKIILISSIKSKEELPFSLKFIGSSGLHKLFTKKLTLKTFPFWGNYQGYKSKEEKELFVNMIGLQSDKYLQWALMQVSKWNNLGVSAEIIHIHGDADRTFPLALVRSPDFVVNNGNHFMVYKQGDLISGILNEVLNVKD